MLKRSFIAMSIYLLLSFSNIALAVDNGAPPGFQTQEEYQATLANQANQQSTGGGGISIFLLLALISLGLIRKYK